jgi:hypothetical protein
VKTPNATVTSLSVAMKKLVCEGLAFLYYRKV